jgi:hypothetical protein
MKLQELYLFIENNWDEIVKLNKNHEACNRF